MVSRRFFEQALTGWMKGDGPESDIVISSRVRIARNLSGYPFPMLSTKSQSEEVLGMVAQLHEANGLEQWGPFELLLLSSLNDVEKKVLVEKHLISPNLANESQNGAVLLNQTESVSIMINEEDHIRIQVMTPGFQIREAWSMANQVDDTFEEALEYAFDEKRGFLTSCPTNVGTGIRASVMIHLPALVMTQQINRILQAITQVGLAVRGIYGEGSEAVGNLFQISNQITLGQSEEEILDNLHSVVRQIIEHERGARQVLASESKARVQDRVCRSYGILTHAVIMDSKEAAQRLSDVRLGADLGMVDHVSQSALNELLVMTQPAFLQQLSGEKLSAEGRDIRRAELIRSRLASK
ncbi:MAG: protein arginine kinase [Paenibacillaceae bacterium]|jgi:protein arginine kinase|nr:protein arginine kinase [Paenibacillaceae bacterium]